MKEGQPQAIQLSDYEVPPYLVEQTRLHVDIREGETIVTATLAIARNPDSDAVPDLELDGGGLETLELAIDGKALMSNEYSETDELLTLHAVPERFELRTVVRIKPEENTALEGLYRSGEMYCTQCEAQGFRNITWYPDRPDVMSTFETTVVADRVRYPNLLSNGNAIARGEDADRHWVTWQDPFRKPAYLFALVAGDLQHVDDTFTTMSGREVQLQIFTEAHNIDKVDFAMDSLKRSMAWDEKVYGREYDLDIFMIVAVESFNMGAMENKGLNIFNTSCVLARPDTTTDAGYRRVEGVVAHEYFHNWSGNRVTCRDWFQLSLKEGFTVLRDQQFSADMTSETVCRISDVAQLRSLQFPEDAGPMAHPIRPDSYIEINNFYTTTVYEKGAEVVRMIRTLLGAERFRQGTDLYFARHDGQAVTTEDFVVAMEDASGVDLTQFRRWYSQAGTPRVDVTSDYDPVAKEVTLTLCQSCPPTPGQVDKAPFHMPVAIGLLDTAGQDMAVAVGDADVADVVTGNGQHTLVLNLRESEQQFTFSGVESKPVLSLLRGFSAPVKLDYPCDRDELMFLMSHDNDGFNRWEAGQTLMEAVINDVVGQLQQGAKPEIDQRLVNACAANLDQALTDAGADKAMLAQMLVMPAETYLVELADVADVSAINAARSEVIRHLATQLEGQWLTVYKANQSSDPFEATAAAYAQRALKNVALDYLVAGGGDTALGLAVEQFRSASNMTDTSAALRGLLASDDAAAEAPREEALVTFYNRWADEALVIDLWFTMQALSPREGALDRVKDLLGHDAFTMTNPNRMRSLIGAFAQNLVQFHAADGSGYQFLADRIIELDRINPQMAARLMRPLTGWQKFDPARQQLIKAELERILASESLSNDVYEIASKSV